MLEIVTSLVYISHRLIIVQLSLVSLESRRSSSNNTRFHILTRLHHIQRLGTLTKRSLRVSHNSRQCRSVCLYSAFLILDAKALASAFGIEEVSSACATHSFSEAAAEPGRQMSAPDIGTTEFAGLNFFSSAAYLSAPTALVAAPPNVSSALPDPPNVTQLAGLTPENTACFNTPL